MTKTIAFEYPQNWYVIDENINSGSLHILSYDITNPALKPHRFDEGMTKIEIIRIYNPETIPQTEYIKVPGDNKDYLIISFLGDKSNRPLYNRILESLTFTEE